MTNGIDLRPCPLERSAPSSHPPTVGLILEFYVIVHGLLLICEGHQDNCQFLRMKAILDIWIYSILMSSGMFMDCSSKCCASVGGWGALFFLGAGCNPKYFTVNFHLFWDFPVSIDVAAFHNGLGKVGQIHWIIILKKADLKTKESTKLPLLAKYHTTAPSWQVPAGPWESHSAPRFRSPRCCPAIPWAHELWYSLLSLLPWDMSLSILALVDFLCSQELGSRIPPGACKLGFTCIPVEHIEPASQNLKWLRACENAYFASTLMVLPSELRQLTWQVLFQILDIISLRKNKEKKCWRFWSWSLQGCSEPASQARGLAWILRPGP